MALVGPIANPHFILLRGYEGLKWEFGETSTCALAMRTKRSMQILKSESALTIFTFPNNTCVGFIFFEFIQFSS